jgi:hypothetical protein
MNEQQGPAKAPPSVEQSLKYMAWDIKTIGQEIKNLNGTILSLMEIFAKYAGSKVSSAARPSQEIPF